MEYLFKGTGITKIYLDQDPQAAMNKKMGNFYEADLQKAQARAQGINDGTVPIASISRQIGRKLQVQTNTAPPAGFNISPTEDPSITSGLTKEYVEGEDISLLGGSSLALEPEGDNI